MPIDASIYQQLRPLDIMGSVQQGMRLADMASDRALKQKQVAEDQAIKDAYKAGVVTNPDGTTTVDHGKRMSALAGVNPMEAERYGRQVQAEKAQKAQLDWSNYQKLGQLTAAAQNQQDWDGAIKLAQSWGIDTSQVNPQFDPRTRDYIAGSLLTQSDRMAQKRHEEDLRARAADRAESREERRYLHGVRTSEAHEKRMDDKVEKLSTKLAPMQGIMTAMDGVNQTLGFDINKYDPKTGKVDGKKVDLPGVSIPGIGRVSGYSSDGRQLQSAVAKVFNVELKDRSGAAVTTPELERLKLEFGSGKYNTEPELIGALQQYQRAAHAAMKNAESGFNPEVVARYGERGAMTSASVAPAPRAPRTESTGGGGFGLNKAHAGQAPKPLKTNEIDWAD